MKKLSLFVLLCCSLGIWAQKIENTFCYFDNPNGLYKNYAEYLPASEKDHTLYIANPAHIVPNVMGAEIRIEDMIKENSTWGLLYALESFIIVDVLKGNKPNELKQKERDFIAPLRRLVEKGCVKSSDIEGGGKGLNAMGDEFWLFPDCKVEDVLPVSGPRTITFMGVNNAEVTDYRVDIAKSPASLYVFMGNALQHRIRIYRYYDPKADMSVFVVFSQTGIDRDCKLTKEQKEEVALIRYIFQEAAGLNPESKPGGIDNLPKDQKEKVELIRLFAEQARKTNPDNNYASVFEWLEKSTWKNLEPDFQKYFHLKYKPGNTLSGSTPPSSPTPTPSGRTTTLESSTTIVVHTVTDCPAVPIDPEPVDKCEECVKNGCKDCKKCGKCEECREKCRIRTVRYKEEIPIKMLLVPGGEFTMGCQQGECESVEKPAHKVKVDSFYIAEIEVTQQLYASVMGKNPSKFQQGGNYPVDNVSWNDCQEFLRRLNAETKLHYDLPTEAQWEYAARGGQATDSPNYIYSGDDEIDSVAWYKDGTEHFTMPVGSKKPNALGLYDMSGNVMEWCKDRMGNYTAEAQTNPQGPAEGSNYVLRGGNWDSPAKNCRVTYRYSSNPMYRMKTFGLRLVLSLEEGDSLQDAE